MFRHKIVIGLVLLLIGIGLIPVYLTASRTVLAQGHGWLILFGFLVSVPLGIAIGLHLP